MKSYLCITLWSIGLIFVAFSQKLPFNPVSILHDPKNKNLAYVFQPISNSNTHQIVSIDSSSTLIGSNVSFNVISKDLPFSTDSGAAFTPSISELGEISVFTGACDSPNTSTIWRFTNFNSSLRGSGRWARASTHMAIGLAPASLPRSNFLSRAFEFSPFVEGNLTQTKFYVFGGMCPKSNANVTTWQTAAQYTNHMTRLTPITDMDYSIDVTSGRSSPVAEAGFSLTKLAPTFSNSSNFKTQQQDFVLIGGHSESAFISMSQVAIWSLPEEAWNFVKINVLPTTSPSPGANAVSDLSTIDSRSGHTAVLTEDGSQIIVCGGWVGDVGQSAEPQVMILSLGSGYGGSGNWEWSIPSSQPSGPGIYGHGATMLPGNVMMVMGGFEIGSSSNSAPEPRSKAMFFNATSLTWYSNYTNPEYVSRQSLLQEPSSLGMRIAVGLGLAAVAGAVLLCVGYKRHRKHKGRREDNIRSLSVIATNSNVNPSREMGSIGGAFPWSNGTCNRAKDEYDDHNLESHRATARYENISPALESSTDPVYILPPPSRHLMSKSSYSKLRGSYQPASFEVGGLGASLGTAGAIHPIYEADENDEDEENTGDIGLEAGRPVSVRHSLNTRRESDPFKDPQTHHDESSRLSMPRSINTHDLDKDTQEREREIKDWVTECVGADVLINAHRRSQSSTGQISPSRRATIVTASSPDSLTAEEDHGSVSNLSEQTEKSAHTASQNSQSNSLRGFIMGMNPFSSNDRSTTITKPSSRTNLASAFDDSLQPMPQLPRITAGSTHSSRSGKSFRSAQTSIIALQNEGEHLLSQPIERASIRAVSPTPEDEEFSSSGSPSKLKPHTLGRSNVSWLGSLRKVLVTAPDDTPTNVKPNEPDSQNLGISPTNSHHEQGTMRALRRTDNAGGNLWRRKLSRSDLSESYPNSPAAASGCSKISDEISRGVLHHRGESEEECDMGRPTENRPVQATYTAPKDRLRFMNQEEFEDAREKLSTPGGSSNGKPLLLKLDTRDLASKRSAEMRLANESPAGSLNEDMPRSAKGKGKVGGYGVSQRLFKTQIDEFEDGDLSLNRNEDKKEFMEMDHSPASASKLNSRKSRVLEMVERMEAHS